MRRLALALTVILVTLTITLIASPLVFAATCEPDNNGSRHTIKVVPVGSTETGDPIITNTPANLMILHTGQGPIKNVWLILVLNKQTYDALNKITINGTTFMTKTDFSLVTKKKIPPTLPDPAKNYPGSVYQYEVSAIKDKMDEKGNPVYYGYKYFLNKITKDPTHFTLTLEFDSPVSDVKALVLALGRYDCPTLLHTNCNHPEPFNTYNSYSKSTLVVPEIATAAIAAAPLAALGLLYTAKRRKK